MAKYAANLTLIHFQELIADDDYQKIITELKAYASLSYGEQFKNIPSIGLRLEKNTYRDGIPALMKRETQLQKTNFDFENIIVQIQVLF